MSAGGLVAVVLLRQRAVREQVKASAAYAEARYYRDELVAHDRVTEGAVLLPAAQRAAARQYVNVRYRLACAMAQAHAGLADIVRSELQHVEADERGQA